VLAIRSLWLDEETAEFRMSGEEADDWIEGLDRINKVLGGRRRGKFAYALIFQPHRSISRAAGMKLGKPLPVDCFPIFSLSGGD